MDDSGQDLLAEVRAGRMHLSQYLKIQNEQQKALQNRPRPLRIDEHLDLEETDKADKARRLQHPAHETPKLRQNIEDRWSTTGQKPPKPGE